MCHRHTPSSKRNLSTKVFAKSAATCFCRLLKTSTPFIRGWLILSRPLFWFVQTSPRLFAVRWSPACPFLRQSAPRRSCLRLSLSVCLLFPSYPSLPAPAPAACVCCRSRTCPRLFAVRWSPVCPFLRPSVPVSPSLRRLVAVTHVITPSHPARHPFLFVSRHHLPSSPVSVA